MELEIEYTRETSGNYMIIHGKQQLDCYEMKMIEANSIPGLLPLTIRRVNNQPLYMYRISNQNSMAEIYEREAPGTVEIDAFLSSLKDALKSMGQYLLRPNGLLLEADHIFIDRTTKRVTFAYMETEDSDFFTNLKKLFEDCILQTVDHSDKTAVVTVYGTYKRLCGTNCSIQGLFEQEETDTEPSIHTEVRTEPRILPDHETEEREEPDLLRKYALFGVFGLMGCLAIYAILATFLERLRIPHTAGELYGVLFLALGVGGYFLFRWYRENASLFVKLVKREVAIPFEHEKIVIKRAAENPPDSTGAQHSNVTNGTASTPHAADAHSSREEERPAVSLQQEPEEGTVLLSEISRVNTPYLRWIEDGIQREYPLCGNTIIGSSAKADCIIRHTGVSRTHAQVIVLPDHSGYFLKDMNSTNATFLSGQPLNPFQLHPLNSGDIIKLGELKVEFVL